MLFIDLLVFLAAVGVIVLFITQVSIPFVRGTRFFPNFRRSEVHAKVVETEHAIQDTEEALQLKALTEDLNRRKANLKGKK